MLYDSGSPLDSRWYIVFQLDELGAPSQQTGGSPQERAVMTRYCAGCHNQKMKAGGLALETLDVNNVAQHSEAWEKVVRKLRTRSMPPAGLPRPDEHTYKAILASLETSLDSAAAAKPNPGRTDTFRRLNRTEYQNAIRDLLALDVDVAALLPSDESSHGFDNVTVGDLSPTLLERYLSAARKISRLAVGSPAAIAGRRHHHASAGPDAGGALRRAAARHARRRWSSTTPFRSMASTRFRSGWRATATSTSKG